MTAVLTFENLDLYPKCTVYTMTVVLTFENLNLYPKCTVYTMTVVLTFENLDLYQVADGGRGGERETRNSQKSARCQMYCIQ